MTVLSPGLNNPCEPNPCMNGGQCTAVDSKPICTCPEEFEGDFCEKSKGDEQELAVCISSTNILVRDILFRLLFRTSDQ